MHRIIATVLRVQSISVLLLLVSIAVHAQSSAFTYQGRLLDSGASANGPYEMEFRLFDSMVDGAQQPQSAPVTIALTVANGNFVNVTAGVFVVQLDFGRDAFPGADRYLQISVRHPGEESFTVLSRQAIGATPYAVRSLSAATADNATDLKNHLSNAGTLNNPANPVDWTQLKNVPSSATGSTTLTAGPGLSISGQVISNTGVLAVGANGPLSSTGGQTPKISLSGVVPILNGGTGSATQNFVDLSNNQTINGKKTFSSSIIAAGINLKGNGRVVPYDPALVATLRWDLLPLGYGDFPSSGHPKGIAFDGTNIWVSNSDQDKVSKLRPSDGKVLETFAVGDDPRQIAFDGTNVWVVNHGSNNVTRINVGKGSAVTFNVGPSPTSIAFDGNQMWVVNSDATITRLRVSDGHSEITRTASTPRALAFDGSAMWSTDGDPLAPRTTLRYYDLSGTLVEKKTVELSFLPDSVLFDGTNLWVADPSHKAVDKIAREMPNAQRPADQILGEYSVGSKPTALAYDGTYIWVAQSGNRVTKLRASDGTNMGTVTVRADPSAIVFDGTNLWVACSSDNIVSKR